MSSSVTKTIGCRMSNGLNDSIRAEAKKRGRTPNDIMNEFLENGINGLPESTHDENENFTGENNRKSLMNATEISDKVMELREKIKELEKTDDTGSFFSSGDGAVKACVNALQSEINTLINELPAEEEESVFHWLFH